MFRQTCGLLAAVAALSAVASTAFAAQSPAALLMPVRIGDLDLSNRADAQTALQRIQAAARAVCGDERDLHQLGRQALSDACVRRAVDKTVASAHSPVLAELNGTSAQPTTTTLAAAR